MNFIRMTRQLSFLHSVALLVLLLIACNSPSGDSRFKVKSKALGVMNDLVIVSDDTVLQTAIADTIEKYYVGFYPITPRPEPIFDVRYYTLQELNSEPLRKELRTYLVLCDLSDEDSPITRMVREDLGSERVLRAAQEDNYNTSIGRDKWATGQIVMYVFANGVENLGKALADNFDAIAARINDHDSQQLFQLTYGRGENRGLANELRERFGATILFPNDYREALDMESLNGMRWMRKDTKDGAANIAITTYDYTGPEMLTKEAAKARFNNFGLNVSSSEPNTYVVINDVDLPMLTFDRIQDNHFMREYRGIWEMENDFLGGPFQSYAIVNEEEGKLLSIDAFIYDPKNEKRNMMQQIDAIVKRITW
ncbi:MAG: DUF4837 family protein [Bacteroidota bacterium]